MNVHFPPTDRKAHVSPLITGQSFTSLADYLSYYREIESLPDIMVGLTHARMGKLSQRWGFQVSEMPFAPQVYDFIEKAGRNNITHPDNLADLQKVGRQVMVYQTTSRFIDLHSSIAK